MKEEKKLQIVYKGLEDIEHESRKKQLRSKTDFIFATKSLVNYRKVLPPDVREDGKEVRCAKCKNLLELDGCEWTDFEFCPICGQRWQPEGTREKKILYG